MGNGSGPNRLNSRIFTNNFASAERAMSYPYRNQGNSFGGLSRPQYSYLTYHGLADNSAAFGARGARWERFNSRLISFIPPN